VQPLIAVPEGVRIYLALGATAIRKGLDGLIPIALSSDFVVISGVG